MSKQIPWLRVFVEGVVIIGSILLAFGLQAWWDGRVDRQTELNVLGEMTTALSADLEVLEDRLDRYRQMAVRVENLLSHLHSQAPYADSLDAYFGSVYGFALVDLNTSGYESLKSQGIGLISDDALRSQVARVYEQTYARVQRTIELERDINLDLLRPYFLVHFSNLRPNLRSTPLDYDAVSSDTQFLNLVDYRLNAVTQAHIPFLETATSEIRDLIQAIAIELGG